MHITTSATMAGFHLDIPEPIGFFVNIIGNDARRNHAWKDVCDREWKLPNIRAADMPWTWWTVCDVTLNELKSISLREWLQAGAPIVSQVRLLQS